MLSDDLSPAELTSVVGLLFGAGVKQGRGYSQWSQDQGATKAEAAVQVSESSVANENPGLALGPGGQWFSAWTVDDKVFVYHSKQHCAVGSWNFYQSVE